MKPFRTIAAIAIVAAVGAPAFAQDAKPWRHSIIEPKSDAGFVLMASKGGFAAKQGLKIETLAVKSETTALKALLAGEIESYEGGPGSAILAVARGADVRIVGCHWPGLVHGIFARDNVASAQDLKGKTVAISTPGALPDLIVRSVLDKNKVAVGDVKFANLGGDTDRFKALIAGIVDAAVVSTEYLPAAPAGIKLLVAGRDALPNFMRLCIIMSGKAIGERNDDAVRFLAAEMQALRFATSHRAEALKLARETINAKPEDPRPAFIYDQIVGHNDIDVEMKIPLDKVRWMQDQLVKDGSLPKPIDLAKVTDDSLRTKALARVAE